MGTVISKNSETTAPIPLVIMKASIGAGAFISTKMGANIPANLLIILPNEYDVALILLGNKVTAPIRQIRYAADTPKFEKNTNIDTIFSFAVAYRIRSIVPKITLIEKDMKNANLIPKKRLITPIIKVPEISAKAAKFVF